MGREESISPGALPAAPTPFPAGHQPLAAGHQTSPLHGLQMSGSCYTSRISSRAGASPSPEKSPSRLPQKGGGLAEATERAQRGVFGKLASLLPAPERTYIWGDFLKSARPGKKPCKCQTQGTHTSPRTSRCPEAKPQAGHRGEPSPPRAAWLMGSPLRPHGQTDCCPSSRQDLATSSLPTSA